MKEDFINLASGAAQQNISQDLIKQQIVCSDLDRIKQYDKMVRSYFEKMDSKYPDLVLMDINMPDVDGINAASEIIKITGNEVPIVFVSAVRDRDTVLKCRELDAAGYIARPYKPGYVKSEVKRILSGR